MRGQGQLAAPHQESERRVISHSFEAVMSKIVRPSAKAADRNIYDVSKQLDRLVYLYLGGVKKVDSFPSRSIRKKFIFLSFEHEISNICARSLQYLRSWLKYTGIAYSLLRGVSGSSTFQ